MPIRRRRAFAPIAGGTRGAFLNVAAQVDVAKARLLAAVPSPRGAPGVPPAEAVAGFEEALGDAADLMAGWRSSETEVTWRRCQAAIEDALSAAERLRLAAPSLDFESLVTVLAGLLDPLETFEEAERQLS